MFDLKRYIVLFTFLIPFFGYGQYSVKEAYTLYEKGDYKLAVELFNKYNKINDDEKALATRGKAHYHINNIKASFKDLNAAKSKGSEDDELMWYMAKIYRINGNYEKALTFYRDFYNSLGKKSKVKTIIKNEMKQCAYASKNRYNEPNGLVESFGDAVNTEWNEISPLPSPSFSSKFYISSNVAKDYDIFSVELDGDKWMRSNKFDQQLNTDYNEIIQSFSPDGQVVFFERTNTLNGGLYYKTTGAKKSKKMEELFELDDVDAYFADNNTVVFASAREGGYGGYDLYISVFKKNKWSAPKNMGASINGPFDERSPFLSADKSTLYFSSNNVKSFGAYDVFKCSYSNGWSAPQNMGMPINSEGDDLFFKVTPMGAMAVFSSNRKSAVGGYDVYQAFLKEAITPVLEQESEPLAFIDKKDYRPKAEKIPTEPKTRDVAIVERTKAKQVNEETKIETPSKKAEKIETQKEKEVVAVQTKEEPKKEKTRKSIFKKKEKEVASSQQEEPIKLEIKEKEKTEPKKAPTEIVENTKPETKPVERSTTKPKAKPLRRTAQRILAKGVKVDEDGKTIKTEKTPTKETVKSDKSTPLQLEIKEKESTKKETKSPSKETATQTVNTPLQLEIKEQDKPKKETKTPTKETAKVEKSTPMQLEIKEKESAKKEETKDKPKPLKRTAVVQKARKLDKQFATLTPLYFDDPDQILTPENETQLSTILDILNEYPASKIILTCHSANKGLIEYQLYRSLAYADKIASYLQMNDVDKERIVVKSVASSYPYIKKNITGDLQKYNQKVDATFEGIPEDQLEIEYTLPTVKSYEKDNRYEVYHTIVDDLYYSVEITQQEKMYKNVLLRSFQDLSVQKDPGGKNISYMIGLYPKFRDAYNLMMELDSKNVPHTKIIPFYRGVRLESEDVASLPDSYPELEEYLKLQEED